MKSLFYLTNVTTVALAFSMAQGSTLAHYFNGSNSKDNRAETVENLDTVEAIVITGSINRDYYSANTFGNVQGGSGNYWYRIARSDGKLAYNATTGGIPALSSDSSGNAKMNLQAADGYELNMTSMTFDLMSVVATNEGDLSQSAIYYSVFYDLHDGVGFRALDSAQNVLSSVDIPNYQMSGVASETVDLTGISGENISFALSLGWSGPGPASNRYGIAVSNIRLNGDLSPVSIPEPATVTLVFAAASFLLVRRRTC